MLTTRHCHYCSHSLCFQHCLQLRFGSGVTVHIVAIVPVHLGSKYWNSFNGLHGLFLETLLVVLRTRTTRFGRRSFLIAAPVVWNSLPVHLRSQSVICSQFQAALKAHLIALAFHWLFIWELMKRLNWTELFDARAVGSRDGLVLCVTEEHCSSRPEAW